MSFPRRPIGKFILKVQKWDPRKATEADQFQYVDLSSVDKDNKRIDPELVNWVEPSEAPSRARQLVKAGDILVATVRPNLNGVAIVSDEFDGATASTGYCVLRPDPDKLDSKYLFYWVRTAAFIQSMMQQATGANYPAVSDTIIKNDLFPAPPLPEQKRIAGILDKADQLRQKRQQAIGLADEFLRSVFLDMFGDPVTNPKGWEVKEIKEFAKVTTGNTPSRKVPEYYGSDIEWIKSDNINTPSHYLTAATEYLSHEGTGVGRIAKAGSVLITCIAGSPSCVGNAALADRDVAFNQQINAVTPVSELANSEFIYSLALFGKKKIQEASTNAMKGMVSKGKLEAVRFILPPLKTQIKYAESFNRIHKLKLNFCNIDHKNSELFSSLSQKAFAGEL